MTTRTKLDAARMDLAQAEAKLQAAKAREIQAVDTNTTYEAWRRECAEAAVEVDRCKKLLEREEAQAAEHELDERRATRKKAVEAQNKTNAALARRTREEGQRAIELLVSLMRDHAKAQVIDARLNAQMEDGEERIVGADALARLRAPLPREDLHEKTVTLWVFESNGSIVGEQDAVRELSSGTGKLRTGTNGYETLCAKRKFRKIEYREAEPRQQLLPIFCALRLPNLDGLGWAWNARDNITAAAALEVLERAGVKAERPVLTELIPTEPWQPKPISHGIARAGDT